MPLQNKQNDRQTEESGQGNVKYAVRAFDDISKDLSSLQSDIAHLAADVREASAEKARGAVSYVNDSLGSLKATGAVGVGKVEDGIRSKPGQSVTIAFVAGLLASYLFSRRS
jgi:ElaB/YqjD/DUF883 family membrane-anchored ribosome-binding protein